MNSQPPEIVGQLGAIVMMIAVVLYMYKEMLMPTKPKKKTLSSNDWDMIPMGVIETKRTVEPIRKTRLEKVVNAAKKETAPQPKDNPMFEDCYWALVGLGIPKMQAKKDTKKILQENSPTSIEEFVRIAFKK